jgi:hypothetical protein
MKHSINPIHILVIALAGWMNRKQQAVIDYLITENRILKEKCKGKRIRFSDSQRRLLAVKAKIVGRKMLSDMETLVAPDTLEGSIVSSSGTSPTALRWHAQLLLP